MSAVTGQGLPDLTEAMADRLRARTAVVELLVPYDRGDVLAAVHREGEVLEETPAEGASRLLARLDRVGRARFAEFEPSPEVSGP